MTAGELIERVGDDRDGLRTIWGRSFDVMAFTYMGLYLLVMAGMVLTAGGIDFGKTELTTANAVSPRAARGKNKKNRRRR